MDSLAWLCLTEKQLEEAQHWYTRAIEAGNVKSIESKDKFYSVVEQTRNGIEKLETKFTELSVSDKGDESETKTGLSPVVANIVKAFDRVSPRQLSNLFINFSDTGVEKYFQHIHEIMKRARDGYPFAKTLLSALGYFVHSLHYLSICMNNEESDEYEHDEERSIRNLANCLRATDIVACLNPSQVQKIMKMSKARVTKVKEKSYSDLAARVVYCHMLSLSQSSEAIPFSKISSEKYPEEEFFYRTKAAHYANNRDYEASFKESELGLQRFPKNDFFLYTKAGAMKMLSIPDNQVMAAFNQYIMNAPFDDRTIPSAYYNVAYLFYKNSDIASAFNCYMIGLEEEEKLLPCFIPYKSSIKDMLETILNGGTTFKSGLLSELNLQGAEEKEEEEEEVNTNPQLTNPTRLQCVHEHRETLKILNESQIQEPKGRNATSKRKVHHRIPRVADDVRKITFREMDPCRSKVYTKRIINLLITEDPMFGARIRVVVRDDNEDCFNCFFYNLNPNDAYVRKNLCFGSKIRVLNPHFWVDTDGSVALRVDDLKPIVFQKSGKDNLICRYCWKEDATQHCSFCKRSRYCSRSCQLNDWKILKHKLICKLKFPDDI